MLPRTARLRATTFTAAALVALAGLAIPAPEAHADKAPVYTALFSSQALKGFDPVSYFVGETPKRGSKSLAFEWNGATWLFANEDNRAKFVANPEKYAPQYGGYCAWAVSQGYTASGDPRVWQIVNGKLYVNYNREVGDTWGANPDSFIALADENWPKVLKK